MNDVELSEITSRLDFQELSKVSGWPCIPISQGSKFKTNQYRKIRLQIFDVWCKNVRQSQKKIFVHCPFLQSQAK